MIRVAICALLCIPVFGDVAMVSPTNGGTVTGISNLAVDLGGLTPPFRVRYFLNGRPLSAQIAAAPFTYAWQTASVWDGPASLYAEVKSATGALIARSPEISVTVANKGATIRTLSPLLTAPLSGTVSWKVQASRPIGVTETSELVSRGYAPDASIEAFMFFVDGRLQKTLFTGNSATLTLDTTQFANGEHELFVGAFSSARGAPPLAMEQKRVTFDNGRVRQELRPKWREVFLRVGQSLPLEAQWVYTNGDTETIPPDAIAASSSTTRVAAIQGALVTALADGVAEIRLTLNGRNASFRVAVDNQPGLPHFTRSGELVTSYQPGRSIFVRSMFNLSTLELERTPGLASQVRAAGINTLTNAAYSNPADNHQPDYAGWKKGWDLTWNRTEEVARQNGMSLLLFGDDIARTPAELANSTKNPWSAEAIRYALSRARDSRRVVSIDMVDEVSFSWGNTPAPSDGRWMGKTPPIADQSFFNLMDTLNQVPGRPSISWPVAAIASDADAGNWMGDSRFSDYASLYWDKLDWRVAYPFGPSLPQVQAGQERVTIGRFPVLRRSQPMLMSMSVTGPFYQKLGVGTEYQAGLDQLHTSGWIRPELCGAQAMLAVATGMAGVRAYAFDSAAWKRVRSNAKLGQGNLQTGAEPFQTGTDRWQSMSAAFNLIQTLEPHLLQPRINALHLGPDFVTAARQGPNSRVFLAINFSESDQTVVPDFSSYRYADATAAKVYRLLGGSVSSQTIGNGGQDPYVVRSGETVVWLFQPGMTAASVTPSISIASADDSAAAGPITIASAVEDASQLESIEFLVDGELIATASLPSDFVWDSSFEEPGTWHSLTVVAKFVNGESSEARLSLMTLPEERYSTIRTRRRRNANQY